MTLGGESSLLVNRMINTNRGKKTIEDDEAECRLALRCSEPKSGDRRTMIANTMAYSITTMAKHRTIHDGINITNHDQERKLSSFKAIKIICNMLIDAKNSNSIPLPFLTDQVQTDIDSSDMNSKGTNTNVHVCRLVSSLSQANISNISRSIWSATEMSIDLK